MHAAAIDRTDEITCIDIPAAITPGPYVYDRYLERDAGNRRVELALELVKDQKFALAAECIYDGVSLLFRAAWHALRRAF